MGDPLTVVILVAAGGAAEPTTLAIERAACEALGQRASVVVRESMGAPTDGEALALGSETSEGAVVEVAWGDGAHRVAMLRVHLAGRRRWLDRTLGFGAADADSERGRTIGLAVASMLPDSNPAPPAPPAPAPPVAQPPPPRTAPRPEPPAENLAEAASPSGNATGPRYALDFVGVGAAGLGGDVQTGGGGAALETFLSPHVSARIGGAVRAGGVGNAPARALTLLATAGVALRPWATSAARPFGVALRADYVLMNQSVTHMSTSGADLSTLARPLQGIDGVVEFEWRVGGSIDLLAGAGAEDTLATTHVDLNGKHVATLPPVSVVGETGLRLRL
jgi:hypothetical protein